MGRFSGRPIIKDLVCFAQDFSAVTQTHCRTPSTTAVHTGPVEAGIKGSQDKQKTPATCCIVIKSFVSDPGVLCLLPAAMKCVRPACLLACRVTSQVPDNF